MDDTVTANHDRLISECDYWAGRGERSFWNWHQTLSAEDRQAVRRHMEWRAANEPGD